MTYTIRLSHVNHTLIQEALRIGLAIDGKPADYMISVPAEPETVDSDEPNPRIDVTAAQALKIMMNRLEHASGEVGAEYLSTKGVRQ